jgi:DNA-binding NarL/FixJ family response regulator
MGDTARDIELDLRGLLRSELRMTTKQLARRNRPLTQTEQQMLAHLATGMSNKDIATAMSTTEQTVKNRWQRIYDRMGVNSRVQVLVMALRKGLVKV